jgi:hypothetical protein
MRLNRLKLGAVGVALAATAVVAAVALSTIASRDGSMRQDEATNSRARASHRGPSEPDSSTKSTDDYGVAAAPAPMGRPVATETGAVDQEEAAQGYVSPKSAAAEGPAGGKDNIERDNEEYAPEEPQDAPAAPVLNAQKPIVLATPSAGEASPKRPPAQPTAPRPSPAFGANSRDGDGPNDHQYIVARAPRGPQAAARQQSPRDLDRPGDGFDANAVVVGDASTVRERRAQLDRKSSETSRSAAEAAASTKTLEQATDGLASGKRLPEPQRYEEPEKPDLKPADEEDLNESEKKEEKAKNDKDFRWKARLDDSRNAASDGRFHDDERAAFELPVERAERPAQLLPATFYFENTYLGGDAGYAESLRRLDAALASAGAPHRLARLPSQGFDAPVHDGLGLSATLDRTSLDEPGRVYLQVGLRGSDRFGWRRPPLEVVAVIDQSAPLGHAHIAFAEGLLEKLGPQDRLAFVTTSGGVVAELAGLRRHRAELAPKLEQALAGSGGALSTGLVNAAEVLVSASLRRTTAPGTQVVLLLTANPAGAASVAHMVSELGLQGIVTSIIGVGAPEAVAPCFAVAAAGHGNLHAATDDASVGAAIDGELELLARVVARLVRINVRLAPGVSAVRVLGSRPLGLEEVTIVKAREVETDRRLSNVLGIAADRGDDDDGIQTVIPVFYGGDAHVVVLELWAEHAGPVADVSVKYKDLVSLDNKASQTSVALRPGARESTASQVALLHNVRVFEGAEALTAAANALDRGDLDGARQALNAAPRASAAQYNALIDQASQGALVTTVVSDSLRLAARRFAGGGG